MINPDCAFGRELLVGPNGPIAPCHRDATCKLVTDECTLWLCPEHDAELGEQAEALVVRTLGVDAAYAKGFGLGPEPTQRCEYCPHRWGDHMLVALDQDDVEGGWIECGEYWCNCRGTFSVSR